MFTGVLGSNGATCIGMSVSADNGGTQWGVANLLTPAPNGNFNITSVTKSAFAAAF